ncbi:MAG: MotA/TolQ/ExbB proton channel family protein [Dysgonamonadaceae bacterium]|jgi:biopolymer transport protein ExbB|nr:MotA/TolQ/ExbB proton channel family protein [Dysgonamonadaceae bacterium]
METKKQTVEKREGKKSRGVSAGLVILVALILSELFFYFILGANSNFEGNNSDNHPHNLLGTMFKGGFVVPLILTLLLTVIILSVERYFALAKAKGKGNLIDFVYNVKSNLRKGNISEAEGLCAKQKGSVAAIVDAGLKKYKEMETQNLPKETKIEEIKAEIEEATALQLPSMQQNLPIVATISTLGTLMGLFGTVLGMIKSFQALGQAGAVDSVALSVGISEALVNTATGIATGALAIISYSFFSGKIDNMTYAIDEMGFALTQTYAETHND